MAEVVYRLDGQYRYVELKVDDGPPMTYEITVGSNRPPANVSAIYWDMVIGKDSFQEVRVMANFYSQLGFAIERLVEGTRTLPQTTSDIATLLAAVDANMNS